MVLVWIAVYSHRLLLLVKYVVTFGGETLLFRGMFNIKGRCFYGPLRMYCRLFIFYALQPVFLVAY